MRLHQKGVDFQYKFNTSEMLNFPHILQILDSIEINIDHLKNCSIPIYDLKKRFIYEFFFVFEIIIFDSFFNCDSI